MRIVNPGFSTLFTSWGDSVWQDSFYHYNLSTDGKKTVHDKIITLLGGLSHYIAPNSGSVSLHMKAEDEKSSLLNMKLNESKDEIWVSFCSLVPYVNLRDASDLENTRYFVVEFKGTNITVCLGRKYGDKINGYRLISLLSSNYIATPDIDSMDFGANKLIDQRGPADIGDIPIYVEIHLKTGADGRLDVWINNKLEASYRSPSKLTGSITDSNFAHLKPL